MNNNKVFIFGVWISGLIKYTGPINFFQQFLVHLFIKAKEFFWNFIDFYEIIGEKNIIWVFFVLLEIKSISWGNPWKMIHKISRIYSNFFIIFQEFTYKNIHGIPRISMKYCANFHEFSGNTIFLDYYYV